MDLKLALTELGLAKNEATIYLVMLELGITQAGPIVKRTKLHRMLVYTALTRLEEMGLVTIVKKKRIQFFQPVDPGHLIERVKKIQSLAETLVPKLQQLQTQKSEAVLVKTFFGQEGLINNLKETLESAASHPSHEICIMGGAGGEGNDPIEHTGEWYPEYVELSKRLGIKKRLLVGATYSRYFNRQFAIHSTNKLRILPVGFSTPMFTRITRDLVSIEIYQPQITVIQIRNTIVAQSYLDSFESLWKMGKEQKR
ncbi:hypothetical protein KBD34_02545 [Patescibacteria group bacterium]|nr:hypothetical protein [Patescibacteria group bacterium]